MLEQQGYPMKIYEDENAASFLTGAAYHNYGGDREELNNVNGKFPDKELIFTETSIGMWNDGRNLEKRLMEDMEETALGTVNNWCKAVIVWNLMLDNERGPNREGGCQTCYGAVDIDHIDYNDNSDPDAVQIDYGDKKVLDAIGTGKCEGVFQLESAGMKNFMKELKPQSLEDVIAGISLYRPGPMDFIPKYIKGKNEPESITYTCKELEPILEPTYGCIVYQEQVMQIVQNLAGYSMGQADNIRRAMSKKKQYVIDAERHNFVYGNEEQGIKGCIANGISEKAANEIYDSMVDFAKYAFNKSHAAAYAVVAYQTARS